MKIGKWIAAIVVVAAIGWGAFEFGKRNSTDASATSKTSAGTPNQTDSGTSEPVATVHVATVRKDQITEELTFFGTIVVQQGEVSFVSVPLESRLKRVLVTPGQRVTKDQNLFELDLSPAAMLAIEQAKTNAEAAQAQLKQVQQKLGERLATNQELSQAKQAADLATGTVTQLEQLYSQATGMHPAGFDGVVSKIDAQPGSIVAAGAPIVEVVSDNGIEVQLGVEIEDVRMLSIDEVVKISSVLADKPNNVEGKIRLTTETIDVQTRLATIYVSLPPQAGFMLGESVKATVAIKTDPGLIVPRQAVIPDGATDIVYVVKDGRAVEKRVRSLIDNGNEIEISSDELKAGDQVVTVGSAQVVDGMLVKVAKETEPPKSSKASGATADKSPDDSGVKQEPQH